MTAPWPSAHVTGSMMSQDSTEYVMVTMNPIMPLYDTSTPTLNSFAVLAADASTTCFADRRASSAAWMRFNCSSTLLRSAFTSDSTGPSSPYAPNTESITSSGCRNTVFRMPSSGWFRKCKMTPAVCSAALKSSASPRLTPFSSATRTNSSQEMVRFARACRRRRVRTKAPFCMISRTFKRW